MLLNERMKIDDMIRNQHLINFLYFAGELPYKLDIPTDLYSFDIGVNINGEYDINNKTRKILFTTCQQWVKNQQIPSMKSVLEYNPFNHLYTNIISEYQICVELFDGELESLMGINDCDADKISDKVQKLYQTILSYISIKYNHSLLGNDCVNISIEDCGAGIVSVYFFDGKDYKMVGLNIIPAFSVIKTIKHSNLDFKSMLNNKDIVWLNYFNLAIYSFDRQDYLNTVIYCAISLESYLNYLIDINKLRDEYEKYNYALKQKEKVPGFFTTCKFLKNNKVIDNNLNKSLKECYGGLSTQRNDIIHGNITNILLNSSISKIGINKLNEIYSNKEKNFVK